MSLVLAAQDIKPYLLLVGIMMLVVVAGGVVLLILRSRVLHQAGAAQQQGRLLDDLRGMLERGEISQAEFDATKATMAARMAGKEPPPKPPAPAGAVRRPDGSLVAKPGVDLTGAPLPGKGEKPPPSGQ